MHFDKESFFYTSNTQLPSEFSTFFGYCYQGDTIRHYKKNIPDYSILVDEMPTNQGVFACVIQRGDSVKIFTDPLGQYSIFYKILPTGEFVISNKLLTISRNINCTIDVDSVIECATYFSPINNKTLLKGVSTLKPFEYLEIMPVNGTPHLSIKKMHTHDLDNVSYEKILDVCIKRISLRAKATINEGRPVVQLTGGQGSRLALAALMSVGDSSDFYVSCFGGESSPDKKVFNYLRYKLGLKAAPMYLSGNHPRNFDQARLAATSFNGLKHSVQSNYNGVWDPDHIEVTGYYSEGLLKNFSSYFNAGYFAPFKYAKKTSSLPHFMFDSAAYKLYEEFSTPSMKDLSYSERLSFLYINNRSTAQFGAQSIVNNCSFVCSDLIYDPLLILLYSKSKLSNQHKSEGALICELTRRLAGDELAFAPLAGRKISNFTGSVPIDGPNIFTNDYTLPQTRDITLEPIKSSLRNIQTRTFTYPELFRTPEFKIFLLEYPFFCNLVDDEYDTYMRKPEFEALFSIFGFWLEFNDQKAP
jgi:hypothetical protein